MRAGTILGAALGLSFVISEGAVGGDPDRWASSRAIARLIVHLGDDAFDKREGASKELEAIGEPAIAALRQAAASSDEPEIRRRAEEVLQALRIRAEQKEFSKWQGRWRRPDGMELAIKGYEWTWFVGPRFHASGKFRIVELDKDRSKIDFIHLTGPVPGHTGKAIVRRRADRLDWRGTGLPADDDYPAQFGIDDEWTSVMD
jgi:hypothetical protein